MGVDRTDYLMWAVDLGYDNVSYDDFEDEICGSPDAQFQVVYDGMCGNYALAGIIIAESDAYEGFTGLCDIEKTTPSGIEKLDVADEISLKVGRTIPSSEFKTVLFTHFH